MLVGAVPCPLLSPGQLATGSAAVGATATDVARDEGLMAALESGYSPLPWKPLLMMSGMEGQFTDLT